MADKVELEQDAQREAAEAKFLEAGVCLLNLELEKEGLKFEDAVDLWVQGLVNRGLMATEVAKLRKSWRRIVSGA
jgi:hypothetical protein